MNYQDELRSRSIGELLKQLSQETATLVRHEIELVKLLVHEELELAKEELGGKAKQAGSGAGLLGAAGVVALASLGAFTAFLILLLNLVLPAWAAALIVAVLYGGVAAFLGLKGREKVQRASPAVPERTVERMKEDINWAKIAMPSSRR